MNISILKHKILISGVLSFVYFSLCIISPYPAFCQSKEFTRLRSTQYGTVPTADSLSGGGTSVQYYIAPGDTIEVYVWGNQDLTRDVIIRGDGKMSYPLIGTFQASGLSIDQLQNKIKRKFVKYIRAPQVIVSLKNSAGNKVIILGQVNYPGVFNFKGTISVLDAIAMAGDFTPDGRRESIMIISDNFTMHPKVRKLNALGALRNGVTSKDFILKPNDVVYVPRSTIADFNKFLNEINPTINTASTFLQLGTTAGATFREGRAWFMHRTVKEIDGN